MSDLILKSGGISYSGFESVHIRKSMLDMSGTFALSMDNFFRNNSERRIKISDPVIIELGGREIINGWIDEMPVEYGSNYDRLNIYGRDKVSDLIDCSYDSAVNEWKNQSRRTLVVNLCTPFGIGVTIDQSAASAMAGIIESYKAKEGIAVGEMILGICRDAGVIPLSVGDGKVTITKVSTNIASDSIIVGKNAKVGYLTNSNHNRYSDYIVKGYGIGGDTKALSDFIHPIGRIKDDIITRSKTLTLFAEGATDSGQCKKRAVQEARIRAGMSRSMRYHVHGWAQQNGTIWNCNQFVRVKDESLNINRTMVISSIEWIYDEEEGGDYTLITLMDPDSFSISEGNVRISGTFD